MSVRDDADRVEIAISEREQVSARDVVLLEELRVVRARVVVDAHLVNRGHVGALHSHTLILVVVASYASYTTIDIHVHNSLVFGLQETGVQKILKK